MPLASGLGSQFGLTKETGGYGVQVAATKFYEFDSSALALDQNYADGIGLRAGRTFQPSGRMRLTTRQAAGAVPMDIPTKGFGAILDLMHGLTPTVVQQGATAAWLQTHIIGTSQPNKSATLQTNNPTSQAVDSPFTYPGGILTNVTFNIDTAGELKCSLAWDAMDERTLSTTPAGLALATASYPSGVTSWLGTVGASVTMNGSAVAVAKSLSLEWAQPYKTDRFFLGTAGTKLKPIPNGLAMLTGTLDLEWYDTTAYALWRAGTIMQLVFSFTNDVIAGAYSENITFTMPAVQVRGSSPSVSGPDVLDTQVPFKAGDNLAAAPLTITYQSTDVAI